MFVFYEQLVCTKQAYQWLSSGLRIDTKPKPKDQLQKRGRKSAFRPEYLIAKTCPRFGAIEEKIADELLSITRPSIIGRPARLRR